MNSITVGNHELKLSGLPEEFQAHLSQRQVEEGLYDVHLRLYAETPRQAPNVCISWLHPMIDIQGHWSTSSTWDRGNMVNWFPWTTSKSTSNAPVLSLYNREGQNRITFAFSDALNPIAMQAGVHEWEGSCCCSIKLFTEPTPEIAEYQATIRIDTRDIPYYESLDSLKTWWAAMPNYVPAPVPEIACLPMYSTWYSMHQDLTAEKIEGQCLIAKSIGCESIIVDDGWQAAQGATGYISCGDWEPAPDRIPDMKAHVEKVHRMGLKYLLWYSIPFVGRKTKAWTRFQDKLINVQDDGAVGIVDPRYPDVREYLINIYENALKDWNLDGFKLDFVDVFNIAPEKVHERGNGRDYDSVPHAVDRLLTDVMARLRALKPDIMIEFRHSYIGPLMRKYGNMFRAGDCPMDTVGNRIRTIDIRLLCGDTVAHADMMIWNNAEPVEKAAHQLIGTLFSVPQISVWLDKLPPDHLAMVKHRLAFWTAHRDVLLGGKLKPLSPLLLYPVVVAENEQKRIIAVYDDVVIENGPAPPELWIVNGSSNGFVTINLEQDLRSRRLTILDCTGNVVREESGPPAGLQRIRVPEAGTISIR